MLALKDNLRAGLGNSCLPHSTIDDAHLDLISRVELQNLLTRSHTVSCCSNSWSARAAR